MTSADNSELSFEYRFRWAIIFMVILLFSLVGAFFAFRLSMGHPRFSLGEWISLTGKSASTAHGGLALVFLGLAVALVALAIRLRNSPPSIIINSRKIIIPRSSLSRKIIAIRFSEVKSLEKLSRGTHPALAIRHKGGTIRITQRMAGSRVNFNELVRLIEKFHQESLNPVPRG
ncbi:MAG: hypothetical protein H6581_26280 [Bacteroidia bacterium]|nr:hypothetical protein [Bacteroidia bacterium]